jgi:tetratricopeptide (TPR) repeat protein
LTVCIGCQKANHSKIDINDANKYVELSNIALKKYSAFGEPNKIQIKQMLTQHDFISLEKIYEGIFELCKKEVQYEGFLGSAYDLFNPDDVSIKDLDLWVAQTGSYMAYAARGAYKTTEGYWERGGKYISETPQYKIDKMQRLHEEAALDLQVAISKNPALMPAYVDLIDIAKASTMTFTARQILEKAVAHDNRTFLVRYKYIRSLLPRWGGSHEEMSKYAQQTTQYTHLNPRLWSLQGEVSADRADDYEREGDYQSAVVSYTAALQFGDRTSWLKERAICYSKLGQMDLAAADANRVLYYSPTDLIARSLTSSNSPLSLKYNLSDNSYITPKIDKLNIRSYAVLSVNLKVSWLNARGGGQSKAVVNNNIAKIERMLKGLGYEYLERPKIIALVDDQKLSLTELTNEKAQRIGRLVGSDAVIIATIPAMGKNHALNTYYEDIEIKAISVADGHTIWSSFLKGSADGGQDAYGHMIILDSIESKLYDLLQKKLKPAISQVKDVKNH